MINSVDEFVRLRTSDNPDEYGRTIHESLEQNVWFEILNARPDMIFWVVQNKTVPLSVLEQLASHSDSTIRRAVARKRKLSQAIFDQLAHDPDEYVRLAIAMNAKVPRNLLLELAQDESQVVADGANSKLVMPT